jgi:thiol-disulfide isomerase/thioredoxin
MNHTSKKSVFSNTNVKVGILIGCICFLMGTFSDELFPDFNKSQVIADDFNLYDLNYVPASDEIILDTIKIPVYKKVGDKFEMVEKNISDLIQNAAIIHLWATWCGPCVKELPGYSQVAKNHTNVQHIALVTGKATPEEVANFFEKHGIDNFEIIIDEKGIISKKLDVAGIPTTVFVKNKKVLGIITGALNWGNKKVEELVFNLFKQ